MEKVLLKKIPISKNEMTSKKSRKYNFDVWTKNKRLVEITGDNFFGSIISENTWVYKDEYNPEILGFSYCLLINDVFVYETDVFPTYWQAMEQFEKEIKENYKKYLEKNSKEN